MAHHTDPSGNTFVDTAFLNAAGRVRGVNLQSMGFGEFFADTPKGRVDFDRMRGKDFPGKSGRSHKLYGEGKAAEWLVEQMERGKHSERVAGSVVGDDASLRAATIRLAHSLPNGSTERKALLTALAETEHRQSFASLAVEAVPSKSLTAKIRVASKMPKGSDARRALLAELKEARSGEKWWKKQIVGDRVRIRWSTGGSEPHLVIEELPGKPFKRHLRKAEFATGYIAYHLSRSREKAPEGYLFLMENLTKAAMFSKGMNYDRSVMAFQAAINSAVARIGEESFDDWMLKNIKGMPREDEVFYLEVEPGDYDPIDANGKDFRIVSEWGDFTLYDVGDRDDYMSHNEGMNAFYTGNTAGGARKMFKLVKGLTKGGQLSNMTIEQFKKMLDKNKIAYRYVPTSWR